MVQFQGVLFTLFVYGHDGIWSCAVHNPCSHTWQPWWDGGLPLSASSCGFHSEGAGVKRSQEWWEKVH